MMPTDFVFADNILMLLWSFWKDYKMQHINFEVISSFTKRIKIIKQFIKMSDKMISS